MYIQTSVGQRKNLSTICYYLTFQCIVDSVFFQKIAFNCFSPCSKLLYTFPGWKVGVTALQQVSFGFFFKMKKKWSQQQCFSVARVNYIFRAKDKIIHRLVYLYNMPKILFLKCNQKQIIKPLPRNFVEPVLPEIRLLAGGCCGTPFPSLFASTQSSALYRVETNCSVKQGRL